MNYTANGTSKSNKRIRLNKQPKKPTTRSDRKPKRSRVCGLPMNSWASVKMLEIHPKLKTMQSVRLYKLFFALLAYSDEDGRCFPSQQRLALVMLPSYELGERQYGDYGDVAIGRDELVNRGLLVIEDPGGSRRSTRYRIPRTLLDEVVEHYGSEFVRWLIGYSPLKDKGESNGPDSPLKDKGAAPVSSRHDSPLKGKGRSPISLEEPLKSHSREEGVQSSIRGEGEEVEEEVVRRFMAFKGLRKEGLVRRTFQSDPKHTRRVLADVEGKVKRKFKFKTTAGSYAAWALKHPDEVSFDADRKKKKRKRTEPDEASVDDLLDEQQERNRISFDERNEKLEWDRLRELDDDDDDDDDFDDEPMHDATPGDAGDCYGY